MSSWIKTLCLLLLSWSSFSVGAEYWVSKSGADTNPCSSTQTCLTIQKGISLLNPGDVLYIKSGTYAENSGNSSYTTKCGWFEPLVASLCIPRSGTQTNRIVISAAPNEEGKVIVDSQGTRAGLQLNSNDYITIRGLVFRNNYSVGIANWGQVQNEVADIPALSEGVIVEGNQFFNTWGPEGDNVSSIAMWGSKDWIVRDNYIDGVDAGGSTVASGIQSYGVINALVEHNTITNVGFGVFWKDHYVKNASTRELWQESEIRYNKITATSAGIRISIRGQGTVEAGHSYIHHNIINGLASEGVGILSAMAGASGPSGNLIVNNNLIDGGGNSGTIGVSVDAHRTLSMSGNIFTRVNLGLELVRYGDTNLVKLIASDYNIYDSSFQNIVDRYSSSSGSFSSLNTWKAVGSNTYKTVSVANPDSHSTTASSGSLFSELNTYKYVGNTTSIKLASGMNVGPYETGQEVIGITLGSPPLHPQNVTIK